MGLFTQIATGCFSSKQMLSSTKRWKKSTPKHRLAEICLESLEDRRTPAGFAYDNIAQSLGINLAEGETMTIVSQGAGSYQFALNGANQFTGVDSPGSMTGNGTGNLAITGLAAPNSIVINDQSFNSNVVFGNSTGMFANNLKVILNGASSQAFLNNPININGDIDFPSTTGVVHLNSNLTSSGAQTFGGPVTLGSGVKTLSGSTISNLSTMTGTGSPGDQLFINGDASIGGDIAGFEDFRVLGATNLNADVITSGAQVYHGAITATGARTLTGTTISNNAAIDGDGSGLSVVGDLNMYDAISGVGPFQVTGKLMIAGTAKNDLMSVNSSDGRTWTGTVFGKALGPVDVDSQNLFVFGFGGTDSLKLGLGQSKTGIDTKVIVDMSTGSKIVAVNNNTAGAVVRSTSPGYYKYSWVGGGDSYVQVSNVKQINVSPSTTESYVASLYATMLNRNGSTAEIASWARTLGNTPSTQAIQKVAGAFFHSGERANQLVKSWYADNLSRSASAAEIAGWAGQLVAGQSESSLLGKFMSTPEYIVKHGGGGANTINMLYNEFLGRVASTAEVRSWYNAQGQVDLSNVARSIFSSREYAKNQIATYYDHYLNRNQEAISGFYDENAFLGSGVTAKEIDSWFRDRQSLEQVQYQIAWSREMFRNIR